MHIPETILKQWTLYDQPTIDADPSLVSSIINIHMNKPMDTSRPYELLKLAEHVGDRIVIITLYEHWLDQYIQIYPIPQAFIQLANDDPEEYKNAIKIHMEQEKPFRHMWIKQLFEEDQLNAWDIWMVVQKKDLEWCKHNGLKWMRTASIRALECELYDIIPDHAFELSQSDFWLRMLLRSIETNQCRKSSWIFQKCIKNHINMQFFYTSTCVSSPSTLEFETLPLPSTTMEHSLTQNFVTLHHLRNRPNMHTSPSIFATNTMPS